MDSAADRKYTFGPVPSRRLGLSLGVDLVPRKVCTQDCIYCQVGRTTDCTVRRGDFVPVDEVVAEIARVLPHVPRPDYITMSGSGEPTLNVRLGDVIDGVRHDYEDYTVLHLGAQYRFSDSVGVSARINNLLDEDFTSFQTVWTQDEASGEWAPTYLDDYNNKDKSRNLWLSLNVRF